jgi:ribosomal protein S4
MKIRRGANNNSYTSTLLKFSQSLQLRIDGLLILLGFVPNRPMAYEFIRSGGIRISGKSILTKN